MFEEKNTADVTEAMNKSAADLFVGFHFFHAASPGELEELVRAVRADGYRVHFIGTPFRYDKEWYMQVDVTRAT